MEKPGALTGGGGEVRVCACFGAFGSRGVCVCVVFSLCRYPTVCCVLCFPFRRSVLCASLYQFSPSCTCSYRSTATGLRGSQPLALWVNVAKGSRQHRRVTLGEALAPAIGQSASVGWRLDQSCWNCHRLGESDCLIETKLRDGSNRVFARSDFCPVL